ncbi:MAG TPA: hypothetical protein VGV18_03485 [Verrucomicrobiae bacterium]|nr:hypothetical protein [Verrucomicrobiae bacterium]
MKIITPLAVLTLCAICFAVGLCFGHRKSATGMNEVMPSNRPATAADISALDARINDLNLRLARADVALTNVLITMESQLDQQNKKLSIQYAWLSGLQDAMDRSFGTNAVPRRRHN